MKAMIGLISRTATLFLIATILTAPVNAQVYIEGSVDCGSWVEGRTRETSVVIEAYLIGLINGLTLGHQVEFWRAGPSATSLSRESVYLWMDGFCRQNPLNGVVQGAIALYQERSGWRP